MDWTQHSCEIIKYKAEIFILSNWCCGLRIIIGGTDPVDFAFIPLNSYKMGWSGAGNKSVLDWKKTLNF